VVLEKIIESLLDYKEIKPVNPKGNQPWMFIGQTAAEGEAPIVWQRESRLIGKDPNAGKDWRQEEKETTEDEIIGNMPQKSKASSKMLLNHFSVS